MSNNMFSPRKPIPTLRDTLLQEGFSNGTTITTDLEERLESRSEMMDSKTEISGKNLIEALEISRNFELNYEQVLRSLQRNGKENTLTLAQETDHFGEDFTTATQIADLVGIERTVSLMENMTDLQEFKTLIDKKDIVPVIIQNRRDKQEPYTTAYIFTKQFIESDRFRQVYGDIDTPRNGPSFRQKIQETRNEESVNGMINFAGGKVVGAEKDVIGGFLTVFPTKEKTNTQDTQQVNYTPLQLGKNRRIYHLSEEFMNLPSVRSHYKNMTDLQAAMASYKPRRVETEIERMSGIVEQENGYKFISPAKNLKQRQKGTFEIRKVAGEIVAVTEDAIADIEQRIGMKRLDKDKEKHMLEEGYRINPYNAAHFESLVEMRTK